MADQHNSNIPALTNQVAEDIPDIKENLEFHKDAFQRLIETWSDTDNSSAKMNTAAGFSDGTYNYEFPTNGVGASSVIMLGTSSTIVWMYLNTAPPGWKVITTGSDTILAVSDTAAGGLAYDDDGGNPGGTWTQPNHTHTGPSHTHTGTTDIEAADPVEQGAGAFQAASDNHTHTFTSAAGGTGNTGGGATANTWRPSASIGKLFQLDTA